MDRDDKRVLIFVVCFTTVLFLAVMAGDIKDFVFPPEKTHCDAACQAEMDRLTREITDKFIKDLNRSVDDAIDEAKR